MPIVVFILSYDPYDHTSRRIGPDDWLGLVVVGGVDNQGQLSLKRIEKTATWKGEITHQAKRRQELRDVKTPGLFN